MAVELSPFSAVHLSGSANKEQVLSNLLRLISLTR
jgi:hypothetical protein